MQGERLGLGIAPYRHPDQGRSEVTGDIDSDDGHILHPGILQFRKDRRADRFANGLCHAGEAASTHITRESV